MVNLFIGHPANLSLVLVLNICVGLVVAAGCVVGDAGVRPGVGEAMSSKSNNFLEHCAATAPLARPTLQIVSQRAV